MIVPRNLDRAVGLDLRDPLYIARCRFYVALKKWPRPGTGVHGYILRLANLARHAGLSEEDAVSQISAAMPRAATPTTEVEDAVRKAYATPLDGSAATSKSAKPKPLPMTAAQFIRRGDGADEAAWWERSPHRIGSAPGPMDAVHLLDALYPPDAFLFCGERYGAEVRTAKAWRDRFAKGEPCPPHWIPNTLTGQEHPLPDGKLSRRGDSAVASFRFAVAEFDTMSKAEQLAFWWGFRSAPIVALIDSGGKSIHAILKVDCFTRAEWESEIEGRLFPNVLCPLGCDPACRNEARLSRLPGHFRREKNAWQRLLYLDPSGAGRRRV